MTVFERCVEKDTQPEYPKVCLMIPKKPGGAAPTRVIAYGLGERVVHPTALLSRPIGFGRYDS
jgi:hypothetical protein